MDNENIKSTNEVKKNEIEHPKDEEKKTLIAISGKNEEKVLGKDKEDEEEEDPNLSFINYNLDADLVKYFLKISFGSMMYYLWKFLNQFVCISILAKSMQNIHIVDAVGLAKSWSTGLFSVFLCGLNISNEILGSVAYGNKSYELQGILIHRLILLGYLFFVILYVIHYFTAAGIMYMLKLSIYQYNYFKVFARIYQLVYAIDILNLFLIRFLNMVGHGYATVVILTLSIFFNIGTNYIFVEYYNFGVAGAAWAFIITMILNVILGYLYIFIFKPLPQAVFCFTKSSFSLKGFSDFLNTFISTILIVMCNMWNKEILIFVAFLLSPEELSAYIITITLAKIFFLILGVNYATLTTTGNYIGKRQFKKVYAILFWSSVFVLSGALLIVIGLLIMKKNIYNMFLNKKVITDLLDTMYPYLLVFQLFECLSNNVLLWLRALGHKFFSNFMNFMQYLFLQPIFAFISIKFIKGGVLGIWVSCCIGEAITLISIVLYCYFAVDIEKSCEEIYKANQDKQVELRKYLGEEEQPKQDDEEKGKLEEEDEAFKKN